VKVLFLYATKLVYAHSLGILTAARSGAQRSCEPSVQLHTVNMRWHQNYMRGLRLTGNRAFGLYVCLSVDLT